MNKRKINLALAVTLTMFGCTAPQGMRQLEIDRVANEVRTAMTDLVGKAQFHEACRYQYPRLGVSYLDAVAERTRNAVLADTVYPQWTEWHRQKLDSEVSRLVSAHQFGNAREFIWQYGNVGVGEVDVQVDSIRYQLLAEKVNVVELDYMKQDLEETYRSAVKAGDIPSLVAAKHKIAAYPEVRTYSSMLDGSLERVRKSLVEVKVSEENLAPILTKTKERIADCFIDRKTDTKEKDGPDLAGSRTSLSEFQSDLMKYGCNAKQAEKVTRTFETEVKPLLDEAVRKAKGRPDLVALGTSSVNDKAKKIQAALIENINTLVVTKLTEKLVADAKRVLDKKGLSAGDFSALRVRLLTPESIGDDELDAQYLTLRIGVLNALINPVQYRVTTDEMKEVMRQARMNPDDPDKLLHAYQRLVDLTPPSDEKAYNELLGCLKKIGEAMKRMDIAETTVDQFMQRKMNELIARLNERSDTYVDKKQRDMSPLKEVLNGYEAALQRHFESSAQNYPSLRKGAIWNDIMGMLNGELESMTTARMIDGIGKYQLAFVKELMPMLKTAEEKQKNAEVARKLREAQAKAERDREIRSAQQWRELKAKLARLDFDWLQQAALGSIDTNGGINPRGKDCMNELLGEYVRTCRRAASLLEKDDKELDGFLKNDEVFSTLLDGAIYLGQEELFGLLLDIRLEMLDDDDGLNLDHQVATDPLRRTPLLLTLEFARMDMLDALVTNKSVNCNWNVCDAKGNGVAHYAAKGGNALILENVKDNINVWQTNDMGRTALFVAVSKDNPRLIRALVERGTNSEDKVKFVNWRDKQGVTPFSLACECGCTRAMSMLAEQGSAFGGEELKIAAAADQLSAVRWLVETGFVSVNSPGVMQAVVAGSQTEKYLIEQGGVSVRKAEPTKDSQPSRGKAKYVLCEIPDDGSEAAVKANDQQKGSVAK